MHPTTLRTFLLLACVALLGGLIGGAATLWAVANLSPARVALLGTSTSLPTATLSPLPSPHPSATASPTAAPPPTSTASPTATPAPTNTAAPGVADLVATVSPAVVLVINTHNQGATGKDLVWGSGVIVDERGYVLTNEHVATGAKEVALSLGDGRDLLARYVAGDVQADLVLLKIVRPGRYAAATWADSGALRLGESVLVIGSPLGNLPGSVTTGVVSGLNRTVTVEDKTKMSGLIQTDAAINRGNSGGGLFNLRGELVGIVTLIIRAGANQTDEAIQGISFAVPSAAARAMAEKWIAADNP